jgi:prefoldin subunit 5
LTNRLEELRKELEKGQQEMARLDRQRQELRDTMLRISGAIQVLEELKAQEASSVPHTEIAVINA